VKKPESKSRGLLRAASLSGLVLLVLFGGGLVALYVAFGPDMFTAARGEVAFHRLLEEYDFRYGQVFGPGQPAAGVHQLDSLSRNLDMLEERAEVVENWLSVLKRRRGLADRASAVPGAGGRHLGLYRESARQALRAFPFSEPIVAIAAAAIVRDSAITREMEEELRGLLPRLASQAFVPMRLNLHVLLGDFHSPERAAETLPEDGGLALSFAAYAMGRGAQSVLACLIILRALEGETPEALAAINAAIASGRASPEFVRFAAEFTYDFGDPFRSAELFGMIAGDGALGRQADALWLAGHDELARHLWTLLAAPRAVPTEVSAEDAAAENRALYNLSVTAQTPEEAEALLGRLVGQALPGDSYRELGLIRFSRTMDAQGAVAVLEAERGRAGFVDGFPLNALINLEILKRRAEAGESDRIAAEIWMLLHGYYEVEGLFEWAAWHFTLQRSFTETALLLRTAERNGLSGRWKDEHEALRMIREGRFDEAISSMEPLAAADWVQAANLGRVLEARNASARALEHYQRALALLMDSVPAGEERNVTASRIQFRIARCLRTLGRMDESRRALLVALEFNPDNLNARLELNRM